MQLAIARGGAHNQMLVVHSSPPSSTGQLADRQLSGIQAQESDVAHAATRAGISKN
jgi:hypothetical protein